MTRLPWMGPTLRAALRYIVRHFELHGIAPTARELAAEFRTDAPTVRAWLGTLERAGYVRRTGRHPRAIVVLRRVGDERGRKGEGGK